MNDEIYNDVVIERQCKAVFGVKLTIDEVIARNVPTGFASSATVFRAGPHAYVLVQAQTNLVLADVIKVLRSMNIDVDAYLPPHGDKDYFRRIGTEKFKSMFPGKHLMSDEDIRYYQTLAPYRPALARVARIKGSINGFHAASKSWRKVRDVAYSKLSVKS